MLRTVIAVLLLASLVPAAEPVAPAAVPGSAVTVRLETGNPAGLVAPCSEDHLAVVLANALDQPVAAGFSATITELDGAQQKLVQEQVLPAHGEVRLAVPLGAAKRFGIRTLDYTVQVDGRAVPGRQSFVYATPAGQGADPAGFLYSVCSHPERVSTEDAEREMAAAGQIGIGVMRCGVGWEGLEPKPGVWQWEKLDRLIDAARRNGMEIQMLLAFCAEHAATPEVTAAYQRALAAKQPDAWLIWNRSAPRDDAWRRYVAATVAHTTGRVRMFEVWNEPDLSGFYAGTTDDYLRLQRSAYEEAKRVDPTVMVMTGGFAGVGSHPGHALNPKLQERVLTEASDSFDVHAYHGHGTFPNFVQTVDGELARIRGLMKTPRPLYFNETAMHSTFGTDHQQALTLVKKLTFARARGAIGYTWYDLRNDGTDPSEHEHNYGLIARDFSPKAAYATYNQLITRLRGTRYLGELQLGAGRYGFVFAGAGKRVALVWSEESGLADDPLVVTAPGCVGGQEFDVMGNATALAARGGAVVIRAREEPTWIELPGGEEMLTVVGPLVAITGNTLVVPGEHMALNAALVNPLAEPLKLVITSTAADGTARVQPVELAAHARATLPLEAVCPATASATAPAALKVSYQVEGGPWAGVIAVPLRLVQRIPAADPLHRPADFTIDSPASVVNFCEADPALSALTWKGPADLSAKIWLSRGSDSLRIRVVVRDDVQHQPETAENSWRGDGLQIGFQAPAQQGFWEVGAALHDDGRVLTALWTRPIGTPAATATDVQARVTRSGSETTYAVELPYQPFGLSDALLESGLRFNLIVNDNDGQLREGFIRIAPGIGERKDSSTFPLVRFDHR